MDKLIKKSNDYIDLTDKFDNVTILYADIANFTKCKSIIFYFLIIKLLLVSNSVSPETVVDMLRKLFISFDMICL